MLFQHAPNEKTDHDTYAATTWHVLDTNLNAYTSLAALVAAGATAWPGSEIGPYCQYLSIRSEDGAGLDGDPFYFARNRSDAAFADLANDAARDNVAKLVSGTGQVWTEPGPVKNLWIRKQTGSDEIIITVGY